MALLVLVWVLTQSAEGAGYAEKVSKNEVVQNTMRDGKGRKGR